MTIDGSGYSCKLPKQTNSKCGSVGGNGYGLSQPPPQRRVGPNLMLLEHGPIPIVVKKWMATWPSMTNPIAGHQREECNAERLLYASHCGKQASPSRISTHITLIVDNNQREWVQSRTDQIDDLPLGYQRVG